MSGIIRSVKNILKRSIGKNGISGLRNTTVNNGLLSKVVFDIAGNDNLIEIGENSVLSGVRIFIRGNNHYLKIDKNVVIKGGDLWFEDDNCLIEINEYTTIESAHLAATESGSKIIIGKDCMLSTNIEIRTGDSHSIIDTKTKKRINPPGDVVLGKHVWIGANAVILKGVSIGDDSIIATNSVVTRNVPVSSVAAGQPAKVIRTGVSWLRERINDY